MNSLRDINKRLTRSVAETIEDAVAVVRARRRHRRPRTTEEGSRQFAGLSMQELMYRFESLGDNCEFGLVQRRCGAEPLGLFRFAAVAPENVARALEAGLADIAVPEAISIFRDEDENEQGKKAFYAYHQKYEMKLHIGFSEGQGTPEKIHGVIVQRLRFLVRKMRGVLSGGEKILVCRTRTSDCAIALRLAAVLRGFGPNLLLWVTPAPTPQAIGRVEPVAEGLLKGCVEVGSDWDNMAVESWLALCESAYGYWKSSSSAASLARETGERLAR
jgi:hypothetical protein